MPNENYALGAETIYYLLLFMMQYRRLRTQTAVAIPTARFGAIRLGRFRLFHRFMPALFQERVHGTMLWDMFDFETPGILPGWRPFLPSISRQLSGLIDSGVAAHIDWNIKNFIFDENSERVFYIDQKPTLFVAGHGNEINLSGIRKHFLV